MRNIEKISSGDISCEKYICVIDGCHKRYNDKLHLCKKHLQQYTKQIKCVRCKSSNKIFGIDMCDGCLSLTPIWCTSSNHGEYKKINNPSVPHIVHKMVSKKFFWKYNGCDGPFKNYELRSKIMIIVIILWKNGLFNCNNIMKKINMYIWFDIFSDRKNILIQLRWAHCSTPKSIYFQIKMIQK